MKRPSFQFYPADWRNDAALRMCSLSARGLWWEMICIMHAAIPYGHLMAADNPITPEELSRIVGESKSDVTKWLTELEKRKVYSVSGDGCIYSRRMVRDEIERDQWRKRQQRHRDVTPVVTHESQPSSSSSSPALQVPTTNVVGAAGAALPDCPHEKIIELYHTQLPECPKVLQWHDTRQGYLRSRWKQMAKANGVTPGYASEEAGLAWWRKFFGYCAQSDFLTGKTEGRQGKPPFVADLEWIVRPTNFAKIIEGKYSQ